jgi:23S rRNA (uracil1939-C5)-methyltransferase
MEFKKGMQVTFSIHGLGSSGEGVGYFKGYTIFVDGALPGETILAQLTDCRKTYGFAKLISIMVPSPDRVKPPCPLFGKCGGCQLQHLSYEKQIVAKTQKVSDAISRIGQIDPSIVQPCISSPLTLSYRNKIQLPVLGTTLGLYAKNSHQLIPVDHCMIHCELGETVFQKIKKIIQQYPTELRHVLIKSAISTQEALVILVTTQTEPPLEIAEKIKEEISPVKGVIHNIHTGKENVILGDIYQTLIGSPQIIEKLCGLTFSISAASFFQVNPLQAEQLYLKALELANLKSTDIVLDAYCGVGTISLIFAKQAKKVIGVECVPEAIFDAQENAKRNHITNVEFTCANSEDFIHTLNHVDLLILNPPRKGADPSFWEGLKKLKPKKIIYISCDPATLARDLRILESKGFKTMIVQPFDMFPQTAHVECIALISLQD